MTSTIEWFPPNFHHRSFRALELMLLLLFPAFAWGRSRLGVADVALVLAFANLGLTSVRHVPLFAIVAAPILADALQAVLARTRRIDWAGIRAAVRRRLPSLAPALTAPGAPLVAGAALLVTAVSAHWAGMAQVPTNPLRLDLDEGRYPTRTMAFIRENRLPPRLFSVYAWGGYELFRLYPEYRMFMDGRTHVYGPEVLKEFLDVVNVSPRWQTVLDKWQVQTILALRASPLTRDAPGPGRLAAGLQRARGRRLRARDGRQPTAPRAPGPAIARDGPRRPGRDRRPSAHAGLGRSRGRDVGARRGGKAMSVRGALDTVPTGPGNAGGERVLEVFLRGLMAARKSLSLYPAESEIASTWVRRLHRSLADLFAQGLSFPIRVEPDRFAWAGPEIRTAIPSSRPSGSIWRAAGSASSRSTPRSRSGSSRRSSSSSTCREESSGNSGARAGSCPPATSCGCESRPRRRAGDRGGREGGHPAGAPDGPGRRRPLRRDGRRAHRGAVRGALLRPGRAGRLAPGNRCLGGPTVSTRRSG